MNQPAKQDIDSGTGQVITPGEPVDHVDQLDGQSAGHTIEPEAEAEVHEPGQQVSEKPDQVSRDDIYSKHSELRDAETNDALSGMTATERAHYERMQAEAQGLSEDTPDPFDGDGEVRTDWVDPHAPAPQPSAQPAQPAADVGLDPNAETVTIVVYGMKQEVPRAEVEQAGGVANYQKNVAADERMRRLSTYEASLRSFDTQLQERAAAGQSPQATDPAAESQPPATGAEDESVDVQAMAEKLVGAMYTGDREAAITEAAEVLSSVNSAAQRTAQAQMATMQPASAQTPDADPAALAREQAATTERAEANHVFVEEFSDLSSGVLRNATYQMVQQVAAEPIMYGRPLAEITREAGLRVRKDVFGDQAVTPRPDVIPPTPNPGSPPTDLAGRMALKKRTVVQPLLPTGGRFVDKADTEQTTETNSGYIARMRVESRGQHG